jgi:hypothetical protein
MSVFYSLAITISVLAMGWQIFYVASKYYFIKKEAAVVDKKKFWLWNSFEIALATIGAALIIISLINVKFKFLNHLESWNQFNVHILIIYTALSCLFIAVDLYVEHYAPSYLKIENDVAANIFGELKGDCYLENENLFIENKSGNIKLQFFRSKIQKVATKKNTEFKVNNVNFILKPISLALSFIIFLLVTITTTAIVRNQAPENLFVLSGKINDKNYLLYLNILAMILVIAKVTVEIVIFKSDEKSSFAILRLILCVILMTFEFILFALFLFASFNYVKMEDNAIVKMLNNWLVMDYFGGFGAYYLFACYTTLIFMGYEIWMYSWYLKKILKMKKENKITNKN